MTKLGDALREKFRGDPKAVLAALGLDESLIKENRMTAKPTRLANVALQLTAAAIKPFLAKDAKIDLMPVFKDVTSKNFKAKPLMIALDAALKGKLAKDAEPGMNHVAQLMDHLEGAADPKTADESVSEPQHKAMEAAAHGESTLGIPEKVGKEFTSKDANMEGLKGYLQSKGMSEDDINAACDAVMPKNALDESPEEKEKREKEEKEKTAKDEEAAAAKADAEGKDKAARDAEMKDMVKKPAMDAAIRDAVAATTKTIRETERGIRTALVEVKPWVGDLSPTLAFDSNVDVYRHAATMLKIPTAKTMHADALLPVIQAQPKAGARETTRIAQDASLGTDSAGKSFADRHPETAHIQSI